MRSKQRRDCGSGRSALNEASVFGSAFTERGQEIDRITQERAKLTAEIERMRARQSGEHYARVMDVVNAAQRFVGAEFDLATDELVAAVGAYERGEAGNAGER